MYRISYPKAQLSLLLQIGKFQISIPGGNDYIDYLINQVSMQRPCCLGPPGRSGASKWISRDEEDLNIATAQEQHKKDMNNKD